MELTERGADVRDVLEHLNGEGTVEARVLERQRGHGRFPERDVLLPLAASCRDGEHLRADVDADDRAFRPDLVEQLGHVEARPAAGVEDPLALPGIQRLEDDGASAADVSRPIQRFELLDEALVEGQLTHGLTPGSRKPTTPQAPQSR